MKPELLNAARHNQEEDSMTEQTATTESTDAKIERLLREKDAVIGQLREAQLEVERLKSGAATTLTKDQLETYENWLAQIVVRDAKLNPDMLTATESFRMAIHATAPQRAEALARVWGMWKD